MPTVLANGVSLHYRQQGTGTDVVLLHGVATNLTYWLLTIVPRLAPHHRATTYDLRGHGYSELTRSGYTSGHLAEDLRGLMDSLGIERAHLVGHSYGGAVALHFASRYPERIRSLTMADAPVPALQRYVSLANWPGYARYQQLLRSDGITLPEDPNAFAVGDLISLLFKLPSFGGLSRGLPVQWQRVERLQSSTTCFGDLSAIGDLTKARIQAVTVPTLVISDPNGPLLSLGRQLVNHLPNSRLLIEEVHHFVPPVAPEALAAPLLTHFAAAENGSLRSEDGVVKLSPLGSVHE